MNSNQLCIQIGGAMAEFKENRQRFYNKNAKVTKCIHIHGPEQTRRYH